MKKITLQLIVALLFSSAIKLTAQVSILPSGINGCAPFAVTFTNSTPGVTSTSWQFGNGFTIFSKFAFNILIIRDGFGL